MASIILVGPRCTGKTEKGELLASIRNVQFIDADKVFVKEFGEVKDYVAAKSWEEFRKIETEILEGICGGNDRKDIILAPGGGAVAHNQGELYRQRNVSILRNLGQVVYILPTENLEESARILTERMSRDGNSACQRPSLTKVKSPYEEMLNTLRERDPLYRAASHHTFYTRDMTSSQAAWCINSLIR